MRKILLLLFLLSYSLPQLLAEPANPTPIKYTQPDGTVVTIILRGDERISWAETTDGYKLLNNGKNGWEYAVTDASGNLKASGILAHEVDKRNISEHLLLNSMSKKIFFSPNQVQSIKAANETGLPLTNTKGVQKVSGINITSGLITSKGVQKLFSPTGTKKLLLILVQFSDRDLKYTVSDFNGLMNTVGYSANGAQGSVHDYFLENSYGKFNLTTDVIGPYRVANTHDYYGADDGTTKDVHYKEMFLDAIAQADAAGVDFSQYDSDNDGVVDGVYLIFPGWSQAHSGIVNDIWSKAGTIDYTVTNAVSKGVKVASVSCSNELLYESADHQGIATIGVICHEFGHVCGAPDYYDTDYEASGGNFGGTGIWDVMCGGNNNGTTAILSGNSPAHFNPYTKMMFGWLTPTELTTAGTYTLNEVSAGDHNLYKVNTSTDGEYYLLENRQKIGFDRAIPGHGLMIYHKDNRPYMRGGIGNNNAAPQSFYPVCASALSNPTLTSDPTSYGNVNTAGCPFPGSTSKTSFTNETTPSAKSWAGKNFYKPITNITEDNATGVVSFTFMGGACTPPATQASNLTFSDIQDNRMTINWTRGNGDRVIVLARRNGAVNTTPLNGTTFNANSSFQKGDLVDPDTYVIYDGTESTVTFTDLLKASTYYFAVFEYSAATHCYTTTALTGSAATTGTAVCVPTATTKGSFGISNVSINTINNSSDYSTAAYTDYSDNITNVATGTTYTLSVSTNTYSDLPVHTKAWIDWNRNGAFETTEEYDLGSNTIAGTVTKDILIPTNAFSGYVTMRVRTKYNSDPAACGDYSNSEAEDYTLNITGGCTPPTTQASGFSATNIQNEQMTINWTRGNGNKVLVIVHQGSAVDDSPIGADLTANAEFGTGTQIGAGNYVVYNGTGNSVTVTGLLPNATFYYSIYEFNSPSNCILMPALTGSASTTGCSACVPSSTNNLTYGIKNVSFNTISNLTTAKELFTDYSNIFTEVIPGNSYNLAVTTSSATYATYTKAWIDWNKDCIFQSSEEYNLGSSTGEAVVSLSIPVPANALSGYVRMRVRTNLLSAPTACNTNSYSEAEDYTLKIVGGCTPPTTQATNFTATSIKNNQATINWVRGNGENVLVIARQGAAVDSYPIGVSDFTANVQLGSGAQIGTGNYVVYNGTGNSVTVTGLSPGINYYFAVYEYNSTNCILMPALTGNVTTTDEAIWTGTTSTDWLTTSNWSTGSLPTATTSVTIPSAPANQPLINAAGAVCKNITIDANATVTMGTNNTNDLTINGSLTNNGTLSASSTYSTINITGDWTNNGAFNYGTSSAGSKVNFNGTNSLQTINGSATTDFYILQVKKGSISNILEATAPITLKATSSNLVLTSGVLKISSNSTITPLTSTYLNINSSSGVWNNGGTINPTGKQCNVAGLLKSSAGTSNFSFLLPNGSSNSVQMDGGLINITSYFEPYTPASDIINYSQTGGIFNVSSIYASIPFMLNTGSTFNMSGGTIVIQKTSGTVVEYQNLAGTSNVTGGTLQIGNGSTATGQTIHINSTAPIYNLTINSYNSPTAQLVTNSLAVKNDVTIGSGATLDLNSLNLSVAGNWVNNGGSLTNSPTGTATFNGSSAQSIGGTAGTTFNNLTLSNSTGLSLSSVDATVNGTLTFTNGVITTGSNKLIIPATGSVSRTPGYLGHVNGNLQKNVATGTSVSQTFEIGDATNYTPATVTFANVSTTGNLTGSTTANDHPQISASTLDPDKSINRYWTLTNNGIVFDNYSCSFSFVDGDKDASDVTTKLIAGKYNGSSWEYPTFSTSDSPVNISGLTSFSDFAFAEKKVATGIPDVSADKSVLVYRNTLNQIVVSIASDDSSEALISVYNSAGQTIARKRSSQTVTIIDTHLQAGVYMVTIQKAGKVLLKKIVIN